MSNIVVLIKLLGFGGNPKQADWLDSVLGTTRSDFWSLDKEFWNIFILKISQKYVSANETCSGKEFSQQILRVPTTHELR